MNPQNIDFSKLDTYDHFGFMFSRETGPTFTVFGIGVHHHFDDSELCSMRTSVDITLAGFHFNFGWIRDYLGKGPLPM
jgi:hypothetical protein